MLIGGSGWGTVCLLLFAPLHDSLAMENDCSSNDGAGKLLSGIINLSSCCFLVAIKFLAHLSRRLIGELIVCQ